MSDIKGNTGGDNWVSNQTVIVSKVQALFSLLCSPLEEEQWGSKRETGHYDLGTFGTKCHKIPFISYEGRYTESDLLWCDSNRAELSPKLMLFIVLLSSSSQCGGCGGREIVQSSAGPCYKFDLLLEENSSEWLLTFCVFSETQHGSHQTADI